MHRKSPGATPILLATALRHGADHLGNLLALVRIETGGNIRALVTLAAIVGTIPVLLTLTFFLVLDAIVKLLAVPLGSEVAAALIVAFPFLAMAVILGRLGARRMALSNLEPWRTWRQAGLAAGPFTRSARASR